MYCKKCNEDWHKNSCPIKANKYYCKKCGEEVTVLKLMTYVDATEMPSEVIDYCVEREVSTHYQNDIMQVPNNNNVFAKWLRENGYKFNSDDFDNIGIIAT